MQSLPEILLIDKPAGMTSFDVIRALRRQTGLKKFGHAGTLDPLATGLMILGVEAGTKKLTEYIKLDKEYIAEVLIGESRTTGDQEGEIVDSVDLVEVTEEQIKTVVNNLVGTLTLPVSAYSAIKKDGKPMYKRAREAAKIGEVVTDVPWREMTVYETELLPQENGSLYRTSGESNIVITVRFLVGSGTYIRSLAEELGRQLGYPACLYSLRRTKVGEFNIKDARQLSDF